MDIMDKYVEFSADIYMSGDGCFDSDARVKKPFMGHNVGDTVTVDIKYYDGIVYVNEKKVNFTID